MKIYLALTTLAALFQLHRAYFTSTYSSEEPEIDDDVEEDQEEVAIYQELLKTWYNPHQALKKKITVSIPEYDVWTSLGKFVPTGKNIQTAGVSRFCKCQNPFQRGKRSLVTPVKRTKVKRGASSGCMVVRQEWRRMSPKKKQAFIKHFNNLSIKRPGEAKSRLHLIADWHRASESPAAHGGPAFLPWHREYLFR